MKTLIFVGFLCLVLTSSALANGEEHEFDEEEKNWIEGVEGEEASNPEVDEEENFNTKGMVSGTLKDLKYIFIGRCDEYRKAVNPTLDKPSTTCHEIWDTFYRIAYHNAKNEAKMPYDELLELMNYKFGNKHTFMLWSGVYGVISKMPKLIPNSHYVSLAQTFPGYVLDNLYWLSPELGSRHVEGKKKYRINNRHGSPNKGVPASQEPLWENLSSWFAGKLAGEILILFNASVPEWKQIVRSQSYFYRQELPKLKSSKVTAVTVSLLYDLSADDSEDLCQESSVVQLIEELKSWGIKTVCNKNPRYFRIIQCIEEFKNTKCKFENEGKFGGY